MGLLKKCYVGLFKELAIIFAFFAIIIPITVAATHKNSQPAATTQAASAKAACVLDTQVFLNTVNQWRKTKGVAPLQYSEQLQQAAQARVADMVKYQYYGHTNPVTKQDNGYFIQKYDPVVTWWDEVLDGPDNAQQSLTNFRNSPAHYNALIDSRENYIGDITIYQPETWAIYDNSGNLQAPSGKYHSNCLVIADLADKIGSKPTATTQSVTQQKPAQPAFPQDSALDN